MCGLISLVQREPPKKDGHTPQDVCPQKGGAHLQWGVFFLTQCPLYVREKVFKSASHGKRRETVTAESNIFRKVIRPDRREAAAGAGRWG